MLNFKNIFTNTEESEKEEKGVVENIYEKRTSDNIKTETTTETRICDCCNKNEIIITKKDPVIIKADGTSSHLYAHPKFSYDGGGIYQDDIAVCSECFKDCRIIEENQIVWINAKVNKLKKEINQITEEKVKNEKLVESIRKEADEKIKNIRKEADEKVKTITKEINMLKYNIDEKDNNIEQYVNEQNRLINYIDEEDNKNIKSENNKKIEV